MSSWFDAVTATPLSESLPIVTLCGPSSLASPDGCVPLRTMLCERPVPRLLYVSGCGDPAVPPQSLARPVAWHSLSASSTTLGLPELTTMT